MLSDTIIRRKHGGQVASADHITARFSLFTHATIFVSCLDTNLWKKWYRKQLSTWRAPMHACALACTIGSVAWACSCLVSGGWSGSRSAGQDPSSWRAEGCAAARRGSDTMSWGGWKQQQQQHMSQSECSSEREIPTFNPLNILFAGKNVEWRRHFLSHNYCP